jgi:peptidyl-prolyl cis-trans isomerase C
MALLWAVLQGGYMRKIACISMLALMVFACKKGEEKKAQQAVADAQKGEEKITGTIAKVNGKPIDATLFNQEVDKLTQGGQRTIPEERLSRLKQSVLDRLIEDELLRQEEEKQGITVTQEESDKEFEKYRARFKTEEQFQNYLKYGKTTVEEIRKRLDSALALNKLLEKLGKLNISEEEVKKAYESGIKAYTEPEQVHAMHILIKVAENAPQNEVEAAKKKAMDILAKLKKGADFQELAKQYSDDPGTKEKGGDLGFFRRNMMTPKFEEAAFALKAGEITKEPVRTPYGFHIIKVVERKEERVKPFEEVRDQIYESLKNRQVFKARRELVEQLKKDAKIEILVDLGIKATSQPEIQKPEPAGQAGGEQEKEKK